MQQFEPQSKPFALGDINQKSLIYLFVSFKRNRFAKVTIALSAAVLFHAFSPQQILLDMSNCFSFLRQLLFEGHSSNKVDLFRGYITEVAGQLLMKQVVLHSVCTKASSFDIIWTSILKAFAYAIILP